jgi:hypothetical protein
LAAEVDFGFWDEEFDEFGGFDELAEFDEFEEFCVPSEERS